MGLEVLYLLIPASVILALIALALFIWAIHSGQFDDLDTPALRMLFDDGTVVPGARVPAHPGLDAPGHAGPSVPGQPAREPLRPAANEDE